MVCKDSLGAQKRAGSTQIIWLQTAGRINTISQQEEEDVQDGKAGASKTYQQHVPSVHTCLCHGSTLGQAAVTKLS